MVDDFKEACLTFVEVKVFVVILLEGVVVLLPIFLFALLDHADVAHLRLLGLFVLALAAEEFTLRRASSPGS